MKRSNKCGLLAAILASLLAFPEAFAADPNIERQASAFLQERYETVVGTRSNILSQLHLDDPKADPGIKHLGLPFIYLMAGLKAVGPGTLTVVEAASGLVLTGAREFTYPKGMGMVSARFCYIAALAAGEGQAIANEFSKVPRIALGGTEIWTWSLPASASDGHEKGFTFYAALSDTVFVLANDRQDILDVLNAMAKPPNMADSSQDSTSESVRQHDYWARSDARKQRNKFPFPAAKVELWTQLDDNKLILNVVPEDTTQRPAEEPTGGPIQLQWGASGIWEATVPLRSDQTMVSIFRVMSMLGYDVIL